jgi:hypothetical protein
MQHRKLPLHDEEGNIVRWFGSSVDRFLARCETRGIELVECPPFVRAWINSEQNSK